MERSLTELPGLEGAVLDHAAEFVTHVTAAAPAFYARLADREDIAALLAEDNAFNAGKLYTWAEYCVFRQEFQARFPEAGADAGLNAYCRLFLKNDISLANLVAFMERWEAQRGTALPPAS